MDPALIVLSDNIFQIFVFIEQPEVIEKILTRLGLSPFQAHSLPGQSIAA